MTKNKIAKICIAIFIALCVGVFLTSWRAGAPTANASLEAVGMQVITALASKDATTLADFVRPGGKVIISAFPSISEGNVTLSKEQMKAFFSDKTKYMWGYTDGKGDPIVLTPAEYYAQYLYKADFAHAPERFYGQTQTSRGNNSNTISQIFPNAKVAEYHFPGSEKYGGMDWSSLKLVFEESDGKWYLVAFANDQWGI